MTGEVSLPLLAGLLLPALGFLRHCLLSPPSLGFECESAPERLPGAAAWQRAHTLGAPRFGLPSTPTSGERTRSRAYIDLKEWPEFATLIPDVDYGSEKSDVKHKSAQLVKKS
jgi:hypothetical protein